MTAPHRSRAGAFAPALALALALGCALPAAAAQGGTPAPPSTTTGAAQPTTPDTTPGTTPISTPGTPDDTSGDTSGDASPAPAGAVARADVAAALGPLLAPLGRHPAVRAALAAVRSARAQLGAAYDPVSLSATGGYSASDVSQIDTDPTTPGVQGIQASGGSVSADLTLRPFVFGDVADQADQSRIKLHQAQLDLVDTVTGLQVQTVKAALGVRLAQDSLEVAREGERLARTALEATRTRYDKGGATVREVRDAEAGLAEAQGYVADAQGGLDLARLSLATLVGDVNVPELGGLDVPLPDGVALSVQRSRLSEQLANVGVRNARRSVYPVVQAGYTWNLDDQNSLGVSIESRTLQPKVSYDFQDPGRSFPQDQIHGTFQVGVSASISPGVFQGLEATDAQLQAAKEGVDASVQAATVQKAQLDNALASARRALELARLKAKNARSTLEEAQKREGLGLDIPLATQRAALDLTQRTMDLSSARQNVLDAVLAYYGFFAQPLVAPPYLSEVEP